MRLCDLTYVQENSILAEPIMDAMGRVLLGAGVRLTVSYIERLKRLGYQTVYVQDDRLEDVEILSAISDQTRAKAYKAMGRLIDGGTERVDNARIADVRDTVQRMVSDILSCPNVMTNLQQIIGYDDYTFHHSINTTVISLILGVGLRYSEQQLNELGTGALMHDIGKTKVPGEILNKKGSLTKEEFDEIKRHTQYGFDALRKASDLGIVSAHISFQHHEKWDGSGYPRGLKKTEILEYARIASIADVYDALSSPRVYRGAFQPYEAYEYILAKSGMEFDPKLIENFGKNVAVYPTGSGVRLSNQLRGNVIKQNPNFPMRPWVRVFYERDQQLSQPKDINLMDHPSLIILAVENM